MSDTPDVAGESVETRIWQRWFAYMMRPRKITDPMLSAADQMAFYEIAQPEIRTALAAERDLYLEAVNVCMDRKLWKMIDRDEVETEAQALRTREGE